MAKLASTNVSARVRASIFVITALFAVASCDKPKPPPPDRYDQSQMDLAPKPAKAYQGRPAATPTGPSTALLPKMPKLDPSPLKEVRLDVTNKVIELAPGVKFSSWAFGDSVPGPVVRARVGDRIKFVMTNRSDEMVGGVNFGMPMPHAMDFHAAMVSPQDKYHSIVPGETIEFEFALNYPGVFMYHCGTPLILEHLASGMYGMVVVEPKDGYPTKVDREYAIVQSEFYAKLDPQGRKIVNDPIYVVDIDKAKSKTATQVVFNGRANGMVEHPLVAKVGERVRLFVLNAGPSGTSSFHVVGTIFDRAWLEGNPDNQLRGMQTVLLGASSGLIVEFAIPEKGKYIMVDHEFADATMGAIGLIDATGVETGTPAEIGARIIAERCVACHVPPPGGQRIAPDLAGVTARRTDEWLTNWLSDTTRMLATDPAARQMQEQWRTAMPPQELTPEQIKQLLARFHEADRTAPGGR